jgi:phosphotransferase system HPr (HPr) family protein
MKRFTVVVPWPGGLHLRPAMTLIQVAKRFRSTVQLRCGERIADLRSILSIIALCATMGTGLDVEAVGDDEQDAAQAIEQVFSNQAESGEVPSSTTPPAVHLGRPNDQP